MCASREEIPIENVKPMQDSREWWSKSALVPTLSLSEVSFNCIYYLTDAKIGAFWILMRWSYRDFQSQNVGWFGIFRFKIAFLGKLTI